MSSEDDISLKRSQLSSTKQALLKQRLDLLLREERPSGQTIPRYPEHEALPLSFAQERLWFLDQLAPGSPVYNIPVILKCFGPLETKVLEDSINHIIRRHDILRTTFTIKKNLPVQVIAEDMPLKVAIVDLRQTGRDLQQLQHLISEESRRPFDLERGPLIRACFFQLEEQLNVLLITMHHIVFDGWSLQIFFKELATIYNSTAIKGSTAISDLTIQYKDYTLWQRKHLQGKRLLDLLAFWREQLKGVPTQFALPTDHPRPSRQTFQGKKQRFTLPAPYMEHVQRLMRQEEVTLFMVLLATFELLLFRYTALPDFLVGIPVAGRLQAETESLIGLFVNTLPIRATFKGLVTFRDVLRKTHKTLLEAFEHQELPFEKLLGELDIERNVSLNPLIQVLFAFQSTTVESPNLRGTATRFEEGDTQTSPCDLVLDFAETPEGLTGSLSYNTDLFEATSASSLIMHFQNLLEVVVANPDQHVSAIPLLTKAEEQQQLAIWNAAAISSTAGQCFHHLFEAQVEQTPDAIAIAFEGSLLTYGELNRRANQFARYLQRAGIGPEKRVGVCFERSLDAIVAIFAILKAGGAYIPLDPLYPQERQAFIIADSQATILLTQRRIASRLPAHEVETILLDEMWPIIAQEQGNNPASAVQCDNLAYMIYTSGSTGQPKGVLISHRGIANLRDAQVQSFKIKPGSRILQFASLSFDASVFELVMALLTGATLFIESSDRLMSGPDLLHILRECAINIITIPPSILANLEPVPLPELHTLIVAGEPCPASLVSQWAPGRHFFNAYGPTETTIWASVSECFAGPEQQKPTIGRPIVNMQIYLLDQQMQLLPAGIPGAIYIGGIGLARGYHKHPELTAANFVPHPFSKEPGACLYGTGDIARYLPDGTVEFIGRDDHQVKMRGIRIELEEIEKTLDQHPLVHGALVLAQESTPGEKQLVAYLQVDRPTDASAQDFRKYLRARFPDYMIPARFILLEAFPLLPNGKIDYRALSALSAASAVSAKAFLPPRTVTEKELVNIWKEVLNVEQVGIQDNFFEIGGHSLLAAQVISRIRETFHTELPVSSIFEDPTVEGLATAIVYKSAEQVDSETLDELLAELEQIPENDRE